MKIHWGMFACLTLSAATFAGDSLNAKAGLWDVAYATDVKGSLIPPAVLAQMPAERRAKIEESMKKRAASGPRVMNHKSCVKAEDLKHGAFKPDPDSRCTQTLVKQTATHQEVTFVCKDEGETRNGRMVVDVPDPNHMKGTIDMTTAHGRMNMTMTGKWLGASCAGAEQD